MITDIKERILFGAEAEIGRGRRNRVVIESMSAAGQTSLALGTRSAVEADVLKVRVGLAAAPFPLPSRAASFNNSKEPYESEIFMPFSAAFAQAPQCGLTQAGFVPAASLRLRARRELLPSGLLLLIRP